MKTEINGLKFKLSGTSKKFLEKYLNRMKDFIEKNNIEMEVYDDIEERIAERFMENLSSKDSKEVSDKVVINIINEIGEPKEILEELIDNDFDTNTSKIKKEFGFKGKNKLKRNSKEGILFGVCYGIGKKFDIDPLWIRIVFILFIPVGGISLLLYVALIFLLKNESKKDDSIVREVEDLTGNLVNNFKTVSSKVDTKKIKSKFKKTSKENVESGFINRTLNFLFIKIRYILFIIINFMKKAFKLVLTLFRYVLVFVLIFGIVPVVMTLLFASGITFSDFQFDNQMLFSNIDFLLKVGILGMIVSLLFLILGFFLKLIRNGVIANGLIISGIGLIFVFAFIGGLGFFNTFNEYKNTYTYKETFEIEKKDFRVENLDLFGENEGFIEGLNWEEGIYFRESLDDKIKIEIVSTINSKSTQTSSEIFSAFSPLVVTQDSGVNISVGNNSTFTKTVPYSFLRREIIFYIPKDTKFILSFDNYNYGYHRTNIGRLDENGRFREIYGLRNCIDKNIEYREDANGFVCEN